MDPTEFRQRFKRWQEGEKVYEAGKILPEVVVTADDPIKKLVEDINARSNADFVNRAKDPNRTWIQDWENKNKIATHKLSWAEDNGKVIVYPEVQNINGKLHDFTDPKYNHSKWDALDSAIERDDTLQMTPEQAKMYTENYKKYYPKGKTFDCGKILPKYDGGTDDKTYLPEYEYEATVTPQGTSLEKHKRITNEEDWQKYWGDVGAGYVSQAQEEAAPVILNGMSMLMGNPIGALAGIVGSEVGRDFGAKISPQASTIGGLAGGMVLNPELWLNLPSYLRSGYNFVNHGFRGSSEILPVTGRPNTLRRFVGVGTSGLDDAVESGVIRGKTENPVPHTAHQLTRYNKRLHAAGIENDVIRRFNSGELTEEDWNTIAPILNDQERTFGFKSRLLLKNPVSDSYASYQKEIANQRLANRLIQNRWDLYGPTDDWSGNWNGHNMATFAKYGETLSNKDLFPGDFAVEIQNADQWARDATGYGHSHLHPVSYRPIEWNNPDVQWYQRDFGWLDGKPYMRKADPSVIRDALMRLWERYNTYDKGKSIHINPANKGKFKKNIKIPK